MNAKNSITPIITGAAVTMAVGTAAYMMSGKSSKAKKKQLKKQRPRLSRPLAML